MSILELPYHKIDEIKDSVRVLENLVAVFSQRSGQRLLQVYLGQPPGSLSAFVETISLVELPDRDLKEFDGPFLGFQAIDILREDRLTYGPWFYPIEMLFLERGQASLLYQTMGRLAVYLADHLADWEKQRGAEGCLKLETRIVQTALPALLVGRECERLIAVLPSCDLRHFAVTGDASYVYLQSEADGDGLEAFARQKFDPRRDWVVALEEAQMINPSIHSDFPRFLELRESLRAANRETALQTTRRDLALNLQARAARDPTALSTSISLAAEYWLAGEDTEDLVAYYPCQDPLRFLNSGQALRVYRTLAETERAALAPPGLRISLEQLISGDLPPNYDQWVFSFPALFDQLQYLPVHQLDLGDVLWKAGQVHCVPRTFWLLSQDLVSRLTPAQASREACLADLIDLSARACAIYSLFNPWLWRQGRWGSHLENSYRSLLNILEKAAMFVDESTAAYFRSLQDWYGGWLQQNTAIQMESMLSHLRRFQQLAQAHPSLGHEPFLAQAEELVAIGERILDPSSNAAFQAEWPDLAKESAQGKPSRLLRQAVRCTTQSGSFLSPLFQQAWGQALAARRRRDELRLQERENERLSRELRRLCQDLVQKEGLLYAPVHEQRLLELIYRQEIDRTQKLLNEIETTVSLTINLKNPWLDLHQDVTLTLEIWNAGLIAAENLEVRVVSQGFQLLDPRPVREVLTLLPKTSCQLSYNIRPERMDSELRLEYTYREPSSGQLRQGTWVSRLNVRSLDQKRFRAKVNHYQFGRPIQNPGDFYGRRTEIQNILSHLKGGTQNLLLRGPRRMGKTSSLYILKHILEHHNTRRRFDIPPSWDGALDHLHPLFLSLQAFTAQAGAIQTKQFFQALLESVIGALEVDAQECSNLLLTFARRTEEIGPVKAALEQTGTLMDRRSGERVVVLLDEYDEIYRPESGEFDLNLREFVSAEQRLSWIIASTQALYQAVKSVSSPWFNIFTIIELERLQQEAATDLVLTPSKNESVIWRSDAVLSILEETGRHPAFTQLFCGKVIEYLNKSRTNYVLRDTIETIAAQIIDEQETAHSHFEFYWSDTSGLGQLILLILDESDLPLKREEIRSHLVDRLSRTVGERLHRSLLDSSGMLSEWGAEAFKQSIDWVDKITDALSPDRQHRYMFSVPLFRRWLSHRRQHEDLWAEALNRVAKEAERDGLFNA